MRWSGASSACASTCATCASNPREEIAVKHMQPLHHITAGVLDMAWYEAGPAEGAPVFLMHGFPYDIHAYAEVAPLLSAAGCRVIVPYLRGFGPTRFLDAGTPRSGEQAALGADLLALMDALRVPRAVLAGYDWGAAPPAWWRRCGRSAAQGWSRTTATTSTTSAVRWSRTRRATSRASGTSTTSTTSAGAPAWRSTGES
jgi:pimeloyl-ACP methyl ester carboxylesterase